MADGVRVRVLVTGYVQGVGYRETCRRTADLHRVHGWVRNRRDGRVEAVFEGPREAVEALLAWARIGPPLARVDHVEVIDEPVEGLTTFRVRDTW